MRYALFLIALTACATTFEVPHAPVRPGFPHYEGKFTIDPTSRQLDANWRITFVPDTATADSVVLLLNRGVSVKSLYGPAITGYTARDTAGVNRITVRFSEEARAGAPVQIVVHYAGVPQFSQDSINGIRSNWIELGLDSYWHPVFARFDQRLTARIVFESNGWTMVGSGTFERHPNALVLTNTVPLIDVAFTAARNFRERSKPGTTVYYVDADSATVQRVLDTSSTCASYLNQRYGTSQPLPLSKIVLAPRKGPGYARQNYIVISDVRSLPGDALDRYICHELAHFWSSGAISSGPENWLNEGFAEFVSARFVRENRGDDAYMKIVQQWADAGKDQPPVWTPELTRRPGPRVAYRKAPYIMHQLEQRIGRAMMERVVAAYMTNRMATTPELLDAVARIAGADAAAWLRAELAK